LPQDEYSGDEVDAVRATLVPIAAVLVVVLGVTGCEADPYVTVANWNITAVDGTRHEVQAPQFLNAFLPEQPSIYFLEADVPLPERLRGRMLTLTLEVHDAFCTLVVDGERILPLSVSPFDTIRPSRRQQVFRIPEHETERDLLHLKLEVQHTEVWAGQTGIPARLAASPYGEQQLQTARYVNDILVESMAAIFSFLALASGIAFLLDRRRAAEGWFALMTFGVTVWHLRAAGLTQLVDTRDLLRAGIFADTLIWASAIGFTRAYFRLKPAHVMPMTVVAVGLVKLVLNWGPFARFHQNPELLELQIGVTLVTQVVTLGWLARHRRHRLEALSMLGGWLLILMYPLIHNRTGVGFPSGAGPKVLHFTPVAWLVVIGMQGVFLLRQHARELRALNVSLQDRVLTLEDRNREVGRLNEELRLRIHDRSARLADALGRIGQLSGQRIRVLESGTVIRDRYRIVGTLGQGGMGAVYEVERSTDAKHFALKTFIKADSGNWLARLAREAQAATAIVHPNVVGVIDIDVDASGIPFLVMELVKGEPLSAQSARFGDATFAREVVRQVALGLSALHEAGIVHRDLKPANVLLEPRPDASFQAKIVDFSIARVATGPPSNARVASAGVLDTEGFIPFLQDEADESQAQDGALTRTGMVLGTPMYMAPELARGVKDAPSSSDLWSLGVVAYQIASGELPFDEPPVSWKDGRRPTPPIDVQHLSEPLRGVVERCLEVDPERRPTAQEVATALS
jgi:hypothetical protein